MSQRKLNILMLFDLSEPAAYDLDIQQVLSSEDWISEKNILEILIEEGHAVKPFPIFDDIGPLANEFKNHRPDLVFNLCEAFKNNRDLEPNIVALLELFGVPYTGCGPQALLLCKDKGLSKKILSYHRIKIPQFAVSRKKRPIKKLSKFSFPAIVKPLDFEGSEGIDKSSYTEDEKSALDRISYIHNELNSNAIIEEFIDGREIYVGVLGNDQLNAFHPWEMTFEHFGDEEPKFATYKAKWDEKFRKKQGIKHIAARGLDPAETSAIKDTCKKIYKLFQMKGYGRIDLRYTDKKEIYFIEANPNPGISLEDDFVLAGVYSGLSYKEIINKILSLSGA